MTNKINDYQKEPIEAKGSGKLFLIDKPKNYTSARVVNIIKKHLRVKKAGHSGTLDPMATGLLIVCTDGMTKQLSKILDYNKEYSGVMILGERTRSYDSESEVIKRKSIEHISDEAIVKCADNFRGAITQIPPMFSALKYKGRPLYKYARKGESIERKPREVWIKKFEITKISKPEVHFEIVCSKGTYIRTIVNDFGEKLGVGAHLKELRRLRIGDYSVEDALKLEDIQRKI